MRVMGRVMGTALQEQAHRTAHTRDMDARPSGPLHGSTTLHSHRHHMQFLPQFSSSSSKGRI